MAIWYPEGIFYFLQKDLFQSKIGRQSGRKY